MTAILEIPEVRQRVSPLSVEEYHRLGEFNENGRRMELIRGILIQKMSKSPLHSFIAKRLYDLIARLLPAGLVFAAKIRSRLPTPNQHRTSRWCAEQREILPKLIPGALS